MWKRLCVLLLGVCISISPGLPIQEEEEDVQTPGYFLDTFLVKVADKEIANRVARDNGFNFVHEIPQLDMYLLQHPEVTGRSKRSADDYVARLESDTRVNFVEQQITLKRVKRSHEIIHDKQLELPIRDIKNNSLFHRVAGKFDSRDGLGPMYNDEYFDDQWYLIDNAQTGAIGGNDINVSPVWSMGYDGRGVVVSILDDGIDHDHVDLRNNYDQEASTDMNDPTDPENDPEPDKSKIGNSHGTRCAGEIAAEANNGVCGVGVAPKVSIGGIRILDGRITDELEARALLFNYHHIDIYSASWGPHDNGYTMEGPKSACAAALRKGVENGRGGKGNIYVWATGNGGGYGDMCGADGYVSSIESISVQSLTGAANIPFFGERCCSTMISVPTGGEHTQAEEMKARFTIKIVTTDINNGCIENFEGTSSAAPLAAGCYALLLQANPNLTWRDVQHVTAVAARIPIVDDDWTLNGAGYHVNSKFGFGQMDCARMVELAQKWVLVPKQHKCQTQRIEVRSQIESGRCFKHQLRFDGCMEDDERRINSMEHVQLSVKAASGRRGNVVIILTSPAGTRSELLSYRPADEEDDDVDFTFMTVHNWGENAAGMWEVIVCDEPGPDNEHDGNVIEFLSFSLHVFGFHDANKSPDISSTRPSRKDLMDKKSVEFKRSRETVIKRAQGGMARSKTNEDPEVEEYAATLDKIIHEISQVFNSRSLHSDYFSSDENRKYPSLRKMNDFGKRGRNLDNLDETNQDESYNRETVREIIQILKELDVENESGKNYLEAYFQRKREMERQRRIRALINEIEEALGNDDK